MFEPSGRAGRFASAGPALVFMAGVLGLAGCDGGADPSRDARLIDSADGTDWASYGRTYGQQHYSPLEQINADSIDRLGLAWSLDLQPGNTVTQPIAVDGVVYFAMGYSVVHAVDAVTGKLLWQYDPEVYKTAGVKMRAGWGSRGIGWWNGKVYTVTHDGVAIALDAKTGKPVWKAPTIDGKPGDETAYVTGAPFLFDGKLIIGNAADYGAVRGRVTALDAETGKRLWRFWTVPGDPKNGFEDDAMKMAAATWSGEWWKYGGNGSPWNAFAYDPETRTVFVGTGNGSPYSYKIRSQGKGDNLFLASIVALDADTGKYKWHYQANPGEQWDFTVVQDLELADLVIDGKPRKVIMTAPKNGFYYVIDRLTGKLISARPFVKTNWASSIDLKTGRPVEVPGARFEKGSFFVTPTSTGGHNWQAMSFSPKTGLTYIPVSDFGATYSETGNEDEPAPKEMGYYTGVNIGFDPNSHATSALVAWDPVKQKAVWTVPAPRMVPVAAMSTGGNLVFQGSIDGSFNAYSATDGRKLWSFATQGPALSPAITYSVKGKQYVTVLTGMGTSPAVWGSMLLGYKLDYHTLERRVLTFALDGKAVLPPKVEPDLSKPEDKDYRPDAASAARGSMVFNYRCSSCHGAGAVSAGMAPDLRRSAIPLSREVFASVVRDGALLPNGMPPFQTMTDDQLDDMRQYIRSRAHDPKADVETSAPGMAF